MDLRYIATMMAGGAGFIAFVALGAFAISSLAPGHVGTASTNAPVLTTSAFVTTANLPMSPGDQLTATARAAPERELSRPAPPLERAAGRPRAPERSPASTGSLRLSAVEPPVPAGLGRVGSETIMRLHPLEGAPHESSPNRLRRPAQKLPANEVADIGIGAAAPQFKPATVPAAPPTIVARPVPTRRYDGVLTPGEIARMKYALRLTPDQEGYWPPVETLLREIGSQQMALVSAGRKPEEAFNSGLTGRLYWAARPLLGRLREEQKVEVRKRARLMGFESVASMI